MAGPMGGTLRERDMIVDVADLQYAWRNGTGPVIDIPSLRIDAGERVLLWGPSGSGKSTLLGLLGGVVPPQQGGLRLLGKDLARMRGPQRDRFRADHIGVIFQLFNLVPYLSVVENVTLPCRFSRHRRANALRRSASVGREALRWLTALELSDPAVLERPVAELSVGQQQRVAAARALIGAPAMVLADEPTSALDADLKEAFLSLLLNECAREGTTLLFVSHDRSFLPRFDRGVDFAALNRACPGPSAEPAPRRRIA